MMRRLVVAALLAAASLFSQVPQRPPQQPGQMPGQLPPRAQAPASAGKPVHVEDVIASVRKQYPPLLIALADAEIANGELLSSRGRFDTTLRTRADADQFGFYENRRVDASVEQNFAWNGTSIYSGYRRGDGEYASYDGKLATRSAGEFRAGFRIPLVRDREIDSRRGELAKSRLGVTFANLGVDQQKLVVLQTAISRYWIWVANGRRLDVTREVLETAESRQKLLLESVEAGQVPRIEAVDNERAILQRRSSLIEADRAFQQSAIDLSLFFRDAADMPVVLGMDRLPAAFPEAIAIRIEDFAADLKTALDRRPELKRLDAQGDQNDIDVRLAKNAAKPAVDLNAGFFSDDGANSDVKRGQQEVRASLSFEFPLQNRVAKGRQQVAETKGKAIDVRRNFLRDQITAELQDAFSAMRATYDRLKVLGDEVRVSRELEEAERTRFSLGEGTLFILNLREQATLDAAIRETLARADFQRARATYEYATGVLLLR